VTRARRPAQPRVAAQLDTLYAELPTINCRGLCHTSCGPIIMTEPERQRIRDRHRLHIADLATRPGTLDCPALTAIGRCSVYESRPIVCRIWGLAEGLPCIYGCQPSRVLTDAEAREYLARASDIAGDRAQARRFRTARP
jgi:Fe-S-cluster containining protein